MRRTIITLLLAMTITTIYPTSATAAARHIDATCGIHRGHIVVSFLHRYHVRIGPKHPGGRQRCHGRVHRHGNAAASLGGSWLPFNLNSWTWRGVIDVGFTSITTTAACSTFAAAMIGEIPSAGIDSPATVITGAGVHSRRQAPGAVLGSRRRSWPRPGSLESSPGAVDHAV